MRRFKINVSVLLSLMLLCVSVLCAGCAGSGPAAGDSGNRSDAGTGNGAGDSEAEDEGLRVPDFTMTLLDGTAISMADCRGKKVLLNFWATWCGPCVGEMPALQRLAEEYPDELVVLAVNCGEDAGTLQKFIEDNGYTFPVVLDLDGAIQNLFGEVRAIPTTFIIDEEGMVLSYSEGAAGADKMYKSYKKALGLS